MHPMTLFQLPGYKLSVVQYDVACFGDNPCIQINPTKCIKHEEGSHTEDRSLPVRFGGQMDEDQDS